MNAPTQIPVKANAPAVVRPGFNVFGSLQREIDRLFEDFAPTFATGRAAGEIRCSMDLAETKDGLELTADLPGLEGKDVEVTVRDGVLTVRGEKKFASDEKNKNYHFVERGYGSFSRSIGLPEGVDSDKITASLDKGVLKVTIPTPARAEPKTIEVKSNA